MSFVVLDFETVSQCDLKKAGSRRYAEDPTTNILCLSWAKDDGPATTWFPGQPCPLLLKQCINDPTVSFIAHNAGFEKDHWRLHMVALYGWPDIPNNRWHCTEARCANLVVPTKLDKAIRVLNLEGEKDMEGSRLTIGLSRVNKKTGMMPEITPEILERVGRYCETDVIEQRRLHKRISWLPADERRVYLLDQEINERGIMLDMPLVRSMQSIVDKASGPLAQEFRDITGGLNMTQLAKVSSWMMDQGVVLPNMQKDTLAAVLGETAEGEEVDEDERIRIELPDNVRRALHIRQLIGSASIKKLGSMEACVCSDGRARRLLRYHRAGPGRWAGTLIQPQNFPRGSLVEDGAAPDADGLVAALMTGDPDWVESLYGPAVEVVVSSLRHALVAAPGKVFVAGDFAGIEARTVLALAGQHDKCDLLASGADVYIDMALDIYGMPKFDVTDKALCKKFKGEHLEKRQVGKNTILGCGFQMGGPKFHDRYCPNQSMEFAQEVVNTYRRVWAPEVPKLWRGLENAAVRTVHDRRAHEAYGITFSLRDDWLTARLLSGRELHYYQPRATRKAMPWDEDDVRLSYSYKAEKMSHLMTIDGYGGLITENVVQALARDLLVHAMFACRREHLPIVLTVHDEIVLEVEEDKADEKLLAQIMADIPAWAREIKVPVEAEVWSAERYKK